MLVDGVWKNDWKPSDGDDEKGRFIRKDSIFRNWVTPTGKAGPSGKGGFKAEKGRYHLFVSYLCPWASRTLIVRALKHLEDVIPITVVNPQMTDKGWRFGGFDLAGEEPFYGFDYLHQLYAKSDPHCNGRATVPVLWDKKQEVIVNNESSEIIRMLNSAFDDFTDVKEDFYPESLREEIDDLNELIYPNLNNGVYRAGFALSQAAYEEAYHDVFRTLDILENRLSDGRQYLVGNQLTEADIRLFVTLIRFDAIYYSLFKCNRNQIKQMPHLWAYIKRIYHIPKVADTVKINHIKQYYYHSTINPSGTIPVGPDDFYSK